MARRPDANQALPPCLCRLPENPAHRRAKSHYQSHYQSHYSRRPFARCTTPFKRAVMVVAFSCTISAVLRST